MRGIGFYTMEKAIRLAGDERGWDHIRMWNVWVTRSRLRVELKDNPTRIRVVGRGKPVLLETLPELLEFVAEEPLPLAELMRLRRRRTPRKPFVQDTLQEAR